jgi:hypothetical protein
LSDDGLLAAANAIRTDAAARDPWLLGLQIAGIGWASVELERAAGDLDAAFHRAGMPKPAWTPASRDDLLGASAWSSNEWWPTWSQEEPPAIVVLEPDTEGRLAAALARFGEGVRAIYVAPRPEHLAPRPDAGSGSGETEQHAARIDATRLGTAAPGPLGRARLLLARPAWGPHVIVLDRPLPPPAR